MSQICDHDCLCAPGSPRGSLEMSEVPSIYVVDDEPHLTELYTLILEGNGYRVRAFNNRAQALAALRDETRKPNLLVTDYLGHRMPTQSFVQSCLKLHPRLRVIVASGLHCSDRQFSFVKSHCVLQKPFSPETFLNAVSAALAV